MHKKKWFFSILIACLVVFIFCTAAGFMLAQPYITGFFRPTATPGLTSQLAEEEYRVYESIIKERYAGEGTKQIVINEYTTVSISAGDSGMDSTYTAFIKENIPEVEAATLQDFARANQQQYLLGRQFNLGVNYVLISQAELHSIFQNDLGWKIFYLKYPDSQGNMTLSRVGFNFNGTQALVYAGNQADYLAGEGNVYLLEKNGGQWIIKKQIMVWIS